MIFAHSLEKIFHITTMDSFTVGLDLVFDGRFYTCDILNYSVELLK